MRQVAKAWTRQTIPFRLRNTVNCDALADFTSFGPAHRYQCAVTDESHSHTPQVPLAVHDASSRSVDLATTVLRQGGLVAFPTETVYGLGADAENFRAVERIFSVKGRPTGHPLILHMASADQLADWVLDIPDAARTLATRFWPGPLTLVLRRSSRVPLAVTGGLETVAVRVPAHPTALALLRSFGGALAAPSANRFGSVSPTTAAHVIADLGADIDMVLDGGDCSVGVESTIVDLSGSVPSILRPGGVPREQIELALGTALREQPSNPTVRVSGSHASHYAPRAMVRLVDAKDLVSEARSIQAEGSRVGVLLPESTEAGSLQGMVVRRVPSSTDDFARTLYSLLREFDQQRCQVVLVSLPPESGLGAAIADRLRRAAGPRTQEESE